MGIFKDDPFGEEKQDVSDAGPEPREVNLLHKNSDVDSSWSAQHHTIGIKHDQVSAGDHNHDGGGSRKVGYGLNLTVDVGVSTAADLTALIAMLHSVIEFTEV
jgi:hypothetical protein